MHSFIKCVFRDMPTPLFIEMGSYLTDTGTFFSETRCITLDVVDHFSKFLFHWQIFERILYVSIMNINVKTGVYIQVYRLYCTLKTAKIRTEFSSGAHHNNVDMLFSLLYKFHFLHQYLQFYLLSRC